MIARLFAGLIVLACAACGTFVDTKSDLAAYRNAPSCCASLADLPFEPLAFPTEIEFSIDAKSPLFDFGPYGRSYFKAFELPATTEDYRFVVRSYALRDGILGVAMYFPLVTFLDAEKRPLATSTRQNLDFSGGGFFDEPTEPGRLQYATIVTARSPARYVIVHTSRNLIEFGGQASLAGMVELAANSMIYVPVPSAGPIQMEGSPVGRLKLRLEPSKT
jgi:hypothetical protein